MKKYYDLVVSLIKSHKKFACYENIMEDIINDVYEHANVVLDTVTNESIVTSYLNKIVATSMITVPKKLGVQTRKYIDKNKTAQEDLSENNNINSAELTVENIENTNINAKECFVEQELLSNESAKDSANNDIIEADSTQINTEDEIEEISFTEQQDTSDEIESIESYGEIEETSFAEQQDISDEIKNLESCDEFEANNNVVNKHDDNNIVYTEMNQQITESVDIANDIITDIDKNEDISVDKTLVDKMINSSYEQDDSEEIITIEDFEQSENIDNEISKTSEYDIIENLEEDTIKPNGATDVELLIDENDDMIEELNETNSQPNSNTEVDDSATQEIETDNNNPLNTYSYFDYVPGKNEVDISEVLSELNMIESKNPDKQIKKICELKYKKGLSIPDIAQELDMPEEDVLESLNEIIYAIKD